MSFDYDLFVIGAGSGGVRASRLAALLGKKVAVAEADRPGGTCVLRGCVPKKFMVYASQLPQILEVARGYGWDIKAGVFGWDSFRDKLQAELTRLSGIYTANVAKTGAKIISARAILKGAHTLTLTPTDGGPEYEVTAETILIATGGWPFVPDDVQTYLANYSIPPDKTMDAYRFSGGIPANLKLIVSNWLATA